MARPVDSDGEGTRVVVRDAAGTGRGRQRPLATPELDVRGEVPAADPTRVHLPRGAAGPGAR